MDFVKSSKDVAIIWYVTCVRFVTLFSDYNNNNLSFYYLSDKDLQIYSNAMFTKCVKLKYFRLLHGLLLNLVRMLRKPTKDILFLIANQPNNQKP